jgi:hypothetical protein
MRRLIHRKRTGRPLPRGRKGDRFALHAREISAMPRGAHVSLEVRHLLGLAKECPESGGCLCLLLAAPRGQVPCL